MVRSVVWWLGTGKAASNGGLSCSDGSITRCGQELWPAISAEISARQVTTGVVVNSTSTPSTLGWGPCGTACLAAHFTSTSSLTTGSDPWSDWPAHELNKIHRKKCSIIWYVETIIRTHSNPSTCVSGGDKTFLLINRTSREQKAVKLGGTQQFRLTDLHETNHVRKIAGQQLFSHKSETK